MTQIPFAMLYRWKIDPSYEDRFKEKWTAATVELRDRYGALGSCLARDEEGTFFAFARWPSAEHYEAAVTENSPFEAAPGVLDIQHVKLEVEQDL